MRMLILVAAVILLLFPAVVYWFDVLLKYWSQLKRYHIGRWTDPQQWETAVAHQACKWINHTPTVKMSDNSQYVLSDLIKGRYHSATIQSWQIAGLALGVRDYYSSKHSEYLSDTFNKRFLSEDGSWNCEVQRVDYAMLAYAILKSSDKPARLLPAMEKMIRVIESNLCSDGMISYSQGNKSPYRYVDTLGMICPFLALYGKVYGHPEYIDLSIKQIVTFQENGLLRGAQLPCHAYNAENKLPVGIYGWGRGTAWYCIGMLDTWKELQECGKGDILKTSLHDAAEKYATYQKEDGGFHTILQGGGQYDSSVTATMAYFYRCCACIFNDQHYLNIYKGCIAKLMSVTMRSGAVDVCQGDTHGLGMFSQVYDVMPFAQGTLLRALAIDTENQEIH